MTRNLCRLSFDSEGKMWYKRKKERFDVGRCGNYLARLKTSSTKRQLCCQLLCYDVFQETEWNRLYETAGNFRRSYHKKYESIVLVKRQKGRLFAGSFHWRHCGEFSVMSFLFYGKVFRIALSNKKSLERRNGDVNDSYCKSNIRL